MNSAAKPWQAEPDYKKWVDQATGYHCVIKRHPQMGFLLGYVRVPRSHPLYGKSYYARKAARLNAHGGLTFSDKLHRPTGGLHRGWWLGFDCGHYGDLMPVSPLIDHSLILRDGVYRDFAYVTEEVRNLATQLKKLERT